MNITSATPLPRPSSFSLGAEAVDSRLPQGIVDGALHEIYGEEDDGIAALGFAILLAMRSATEKPLVLVRDERSVRAMGRISAAGIVELGGDPSKLIVIHTADALATLRAAADAVVCPEVGAVIVEPWRASPTFDLTASRRIALRAEKSRVLTLIVRIGVAPTPSAAITRWRVGSAPSAPLAADAPGNPAFQLTLSRHRGGICGLDARVEWNRDQRSFRDAPHPRTVPAVAIGRASDARVRRVA